MSTVVNSLRILAHDALASAKKRRQISNFLKKSGMIYLGKAGWLGHRSRDVVSGFIIEGSSMDTYITGFILPAFDRHEYIHWALGERIVNCNVNEESRLECKASIEYYVDNYSRVKSSGDLVEYINRRNVLGGYPIWVRYISYLRENNFEAAMNYMDDKKRAQLHPWQLGKLDNISGFVAAHDKDGVSRVFEDWSAVSERIFGPLDHTFDAF